MSSSFAVGGTTDNEAAQKFLEALQTDFRNLSLETKKKYPQIKEVSGKTPAELCFLDVLSFANAWEVG